MTMHEGMLRPGCLTVHDGRTLLAIHLPWYRSLPLSCLESVTVDGRDCTAGLDRAGDGIWDLRDPLVVTLTAPPTGPELEVTVAVRIPYIQQAPGVPFVQRATARTKAVVR
ncbi:hypothetical protein [Actinoplanes sp. URMC 104]|uniref:hypothetical protein n=1 Tax=Actinoplanes sp. URMC 104 TaxID=3423409 RepID=UPI003F1A03CA